MAPRIDPNVPLVWRTPTQLQLGAPGPLVLLDDPGDAVLQLLALLRHGASASTLTAFAGGLGLDEASVDDLLRRLAPALEPAPPSEAAPGSALVAIDGAGAVVDAVAAALGELGHSVASVDEVAPAEVGAAVLFASWTVPAAHHRRWLAADVPHLAVVREVDGVAVGPFVAADDGPCLRCLDLARSEADASWPTIAAQLAGRPLPPMSARLRHDTVAAVVSAIDDRLRTGVSDLRSRALVISPGGRRSRPLAAHPACGCRAPGGIATAPAPRAGRRVVPPSSVTAVAALG